MPESPAIAWKKPIMINMNAAKYVSPTAPLLRLLDMVPPSSPPPSRRTPQQWRTGAPRSTGDAREGNSGQGVDHVGSVVRDAREDPVDVGSVRTTALLEDLSE